MSIQFETSQIDTFKEKAAEARAALKNDSVPLAQIAAFLDRWVQKNFQSSGGNVGGWAAFKYGGRLVSKGTGGSTTDGRHYVNASAKLLMDSGALRLSYLPFVRGHDAGVGTDMVSASGAPFPEYLNDGTRFMPPRRQVPVEEEVATDVKLIFNEWAFTVLKRMAS